MSLAKVPVTLIVSYAFKRCIRPPNPPPPKEERIHTNFLEVGWYTANTPGPAGDLQFLFGILEALTIIAWNYSSSPLSQTILSTLVFSGGRPDHLHLSTMSAIGGAMIVAGTLIRLTTYRYLGKFFKFEASIQKDHQLVTGGPYAFVRHPSYTGLILTHSGWVLWHIGDGSWVRESGIWSSFAGKSVVLGFFFGIICGMLYLVLMRMGNEDEALRKQFGQKWDEWAKNVPYLLFPKIY
ncbi:hypothetical protein CPB84DRAFT_1846220 [Gymnopilus junonius]|uniref:Protein-S-isoprenylcysteine O-methyltransferase n=1 Tax=Gymnopilus junonius TaxID=109634 RepID=A0A9P5NQ51_GYMJU|nr:hypothetical protein CPB84DRAFT_1846220 [Gymnopilus junonius]